MLRSNYSLPENIVLRVCGFFDQTLEKKDYFSDKDAEAAQRYLLSDLDREYCIKSRVMGLTQEGIVEHGSCPLHTNEGLKPIMQVVRSQFRIGKGNVGFGSVFYAKDPSEGGIEAVQTQKAIGGFANIATSYQSNEYVLAMAEHHMLPLLIEDEKEFSFGKDDYILIREIRSSLLSGNQVEAYVIQPEVGLKKIDLTLVNMDDAWKAEMLR